MKPRIQYLEGLRAVAALIVVFNHYAWSFYPAIFTKSLADIHTNNRSELLIFNTPLNVIFNGNLAVCIFLLLSGFVVCIKYFQKHDIHVLQKTAILRYFRLLPTILFCNLLAYFLLVLKVNYNQQASLITHSHIWLKAIWTFQPNFFEALIQSLGIFIPAFPQTYDTPLYVIPEIFLGSLICLAVLALIGSMKRRYYIYGILIIILNYGYLYVFIIGMLLCDMYINRQIPKFFYHKATSALLLLIAVVAGSYPIGASPEQIRNTIYSVFPTSPLLTSLGFYHILSATLLLLCLLTNKWLQQLFSSKILGVIGKISFPIYALHVLILCSFSSYQFLQLNSSLSYNKSFAIMFGTSLFILFGGAYLLNRFIENLFVPFGNKVYLYLANQKPKK